MLSFIYFTSKQAVTSIDPSATVIPDLPNPQTGYFMGHWPVYGLTALGSEAQLIPSAVDRVGVDPQPTFSGRLKGF